VKMADAQQTGSMTEPGRLKRKVSAFILRRTPGAVSQLLVHSFVEDPFLPLRVPGGGVYEGEAVEQALFREIREETGLVNPHLLRMLGVDRYFRAATQIIIERHNFLLRVPGTMPDNWEHRATGDGNDAGKRFLYQWIGVEDLELVDEEFSATITPENIPELFEQTGLAKSQ
jgi:ADP-ribose pyrophosphatase YjhB (NUDIX family)